MIATVLLFLLGLALIIFAGDRFVDAAVRIAKASGISDIVIGATVVSLGTTLPEILVSTTAGLSGSADISVGNAFGSIICNTALIAGLVMLVKPEKNADRSTIGWRTVYFFAAAALCFIFRRFVGYYHLLIGIILVCMFIAYAIISIVTSSKKGTALADGPEAEEKSEKEEEAPKGSMPKNIIILVVCAAMLFAGARLLVSQGTLIALAIGVPERVVAVTFIALGTSLPELVTAISSLIKGHANVSVGNILGANLLNFMLVIGIPSVLTTVTPSAAAIVVDLPIAALAMAILMLPLIIMKRGFRIQGAVLVVGYFVYCLTQF